jgi:hypothetical protein
VELISKGLVSIVEQLSSDQAHVLRYQSEREQRGPCTKNAGAVKDALELENWLHLPWNTGVTKGSLLGKLQ